MLRPTHLLLLLPCALALALAPAAARADRYVEGYAGASIPVADDDYDDVFDTTFALGARVGAGSGALALEGSFEWAPGNFEGDTSIGNVEWSASRLRLLGGVRFRSRLGATATGFVRLGAGIEIATIEAHGTVIVPVDASESDTGLALDAGAGVVVASGSLLVGGQVALPIGIHTDDAGDTIDQDGTDVDVELLLTVGTRF